MNKKLIVFLWLAITSALLVWLPNTNTMLDDWRVWASIGTGLLAVFAFVIFLATDYSDY